MRGKLIYLLLSCLVACVTLAFPPRSIAKSVIIFKGSTIEAIDSLIIVPNCCVITLNEIQVASWLTD